MISAHADLGSSVEVPVRRRILVAEDTELTRTLMEMALRQAGYEVVSAANGKLALDALTRESFDVLFLDIEMPELDGLQTARAIRAMDEPTRNIPIIALTAHDDNEQTARCREAGIDLVVTKPIDRAILVKLARHQFLTSSFEGTKSQASAASFDEALHMEIVARYGLESVLILMASLRKKLDEALSLMDATSSPEALRNITHQMVIAGTLGFSRLLEASRMFSAMLRESTSAEKTRQCRDEFKAAVIDAKRILEERNL